MTSQTVHKPVMYQEILDWSGLGQIDLVESSIRENKKLNHVKLSFTGPLGRDKSDREGVVWIDGTLGGAGHAVSILNWLNASDLLVGVDRDPKAIKRSQSRLEGEGTIQAKIQLIEDSYSALPEYTQREEIPLADGILLDLGLSSDQLADRERGFSFRTGGPLDLRFQPNEGISASDWLKRASEKEIADSIYQFGEERFSRRIARAIVERRRLEQPLETAEELADLIHRVVPGKIHGRIDSATRTFQALRIVVNQELQHVEKAMNELHRCLKPGGRLLVLTFHSLEDRIVKHAFRDLPQWVPVTKKPLLPSENEIRENGRSRSAKLRVAVKSVS